MSVNASSVGPTNMEGTFMAGHRNPTLRRQALISKRIEAAMGPLERARVNAGLSLPEVAIAVQRDTVTVRRWELGRATPAQPTMLTLARLYGVAVADLA